MTSTSPASATFGGGACAEVNGISLYYETHGAGRPLVLLRHPDVRAGPAGRPHPENFGRLLDKAGEAMRTDFDFTEEVRGLQVPARPTPT